MLEQGRSKICLSFSFGNCISVFICSGIFAVGFLSGRRLNFKGPCFDVQHNLDLCWSPRPWQSDTLRLSCLCARLLALCGFQSLAFRPVCVDCVLDCPHLFF